MGRMVMDEEELMKCRKHPSKQRTSGVCPFCLRDRLIRLCPDCANVRPCACCPTTTTTTTTSCSSSSSSTTTTSLFLSSPKAKTKTKTTTSVGDVGAIGRISNLIDNEPAFQRSRSTAFHFLSHKDVTSRLLPPLGDRTKSSSSSSSFWSSVFKKSKKVDEIKHQEEEQVKMRRSKSVSGGGSDPSQIPRTDVRLKGRSWYFPSPIKAFRQNKTSRTLQERSPLCRG